MRMPAQNEGSNMQDIVSGENLPRARGIKNSVLASALQNFRRPKDAKAAVSDARMQNALLYSPEYEFDDGIYKDLARKNGAIVFSFSDILKETGFRRAIVISKMRLAFAACRKSGCGFAVCTLANEEGEARNARELEAFMSVLGMDGHEKRFAERTAERLASGKVPI